MRWNEKKNIEGDRRYKYKFLFFPKTINGETRWWESTGYVQILKYHEDDAREGDGQDFWYWEDLEWIK
jgi:hypothetical protein